MRDDVADGEDTVLRPRGARHAPVTDVEKTVLRPRGSVAGPVPDEENTVLRPRRAVMPPLPDGEDTVITVRDLPNGLPEDLERTTARVIPQLVDSAPSEDTVLIVRAPRGFPGSDVSGSDAPGTGLPVRDVRDGERIGPPPPARPLLDETVIRGANAAHLLDETIIRGTRPRPILPQPTERPSAPTESAPSAPTEAARSVAPALVDPPSQSPAVPVYVQHYRFRVNQHDTAVPLDRPAYVGRKPSTPRIHSGDLPRLVKVASPLQEVSSTHLEVRQRGGSVIVTDLRSTNGTTVVVPGSAPRKLRQGESLVVSPGTLVDIGDGNIIEILPIQRLL